MQSAAEKEKRLSDTRGNRRGIEFFRFWYKFWGPAHTKVMIWFVTFFYMLFDREARKRVAPYVKHRFPEAGAVARCLHTWFIFAHQGMCLLMQEMYEEMGTHYRVIYDSEEAEKVRFSEQAAVVLYSHFGPWQVMMRNMTEHKNPVNILAQPDQNKKVNKMKSFSAEEEETKVREIPPGPGSLFVLQQALARNEFVTLMGDRNFEDSPMDVDFLGGTARFPVAGFYLAARMKCPLVCIFAHREGKEYVLEFCETMHPEMNGRDRNGLRPYLEKYTKHLEKLCMEYPYDCFSMYNYWGKEV